MRSVRRSAGGTLLLVVVLSRAGHAQSNVSTQGFGYPPGQLSTSSLGSAGATSEFDPMSALNPAAVADWGRAGLHFQTDPEFRTVSSPGGIDHTTTIRFPLLVAGLPITSQFAMALSVSTLLDRTWETRTVDTTAIGDTLLAASNEFKSSGGIEDLALSAGWAPSSAVRFGFGLHYFTGQDAITVTQTYPLTQIVKTAPYVQANLYNYEGAGVSAGFELRPTQYLSFAGSGRIGGTMLLRRADTTQTSGSVPPRAGGGIRYDGIPGVQVGLNADWEGWSKMGGLGTPGLMPHDAWTFGVGFNVDGPKMGGDSPLLLHLGAATRTLPFLAVNTLVRENLIAAGLGIPFSFQRATLDFALQRALRSAPAGYSESAWLLSVGLSVRP
jgi:hypothetical protein